MPGMVSGASSSVAIAPRPRKRWRARPMPAGTPSSRLPTTAATPSSRLVRMALPKFGQDGGIPGQRVAARREQDQLLVEHAEIERQQQRHHDQRGAGRDQGEHQGAFGRTGHAVGAVARQRHGGAAGCHAPESDQILRCASVAGGECRCQQAAMGGTSGAWQEWGKAPDAPRITCRIIECRYVATLIRHPPRD